MERKLKIGNRYIGDNEPVYLIAEIGINHNGDLQTAKKLLDAAWATGWDCAKFQKRTPDICVPEHQKNLIRQTPWGEMTYLEYRKKVEFQKREYDIIDKYCREKPLDWSASAWDLPSLEFLLNYDVPFIKTASALLTNTELLEKCAKSGKPILVSTGMSSLSEIDSAVELIEKNCGKNYALLHTNSTYPANPDELNLKMLSTLKERYDCVVGYSGHEYDLEPTIVAFAYGARIIERHVTLDHDMWGTDQSSSLEIRGMDALVKRLRTVKRVAGDGIKKIYDGEAKMREKLSPPTQLSSGRNI